MTFYGAKGAWCEAVEREKRTFMGFTLYKNQVFGKDEKGAFVLPHLTADANGMRGVHSTLLIYRLDLNRGWVQVWEYSQTTINAMILFHKMNRRARTVRHSQNGYRNPLSEVKGTKYFQVIG